MRLRVGTAHDRGGSVTPPVRLTLLACWWGAWGPAVIQVARTIAGVGSDPAVRPWRFRLGVRVLAAAAAATGATQLAAAVTGPAPVSGALGLCLLTAPLFLRPPATVV
ncbi:hypothetical protein QRX60_31070 [Amycolatopsis mongoliensis]|uniref:Uncharacterized protein n=1 Tax=Amycolatopsis mongoliensis TaxID=715475 RepID=A0A9Y2JH25_9PSEU|nr:hypothetical protein [Amycolatopsis sp. 4-36]WIX98495.1 hypothetical protein QRX60_31070 [Amycolatopsis sp. 4-36]